MEKIILKILNTAVANGYKLELQDDLKSYGKYFLPGGSFMIFRMSEDRKTTVFTRYFSLFDHSLAKALWGDEYLNKMSELSQMKNPGDYFK